MVALVAISSLLSTLPVAAVASAPSTSSDPHGPAATNRGPAKEQQPVPIQSRSTETGGGSGPAAAGLGDPSIALRSVPKAKPAPKTATEVTSLRGEHQKVTANPNGTYTLQTGPARFNYLDEQGAWQPVDLSLVPDTSTAGYDLRIKSLDRTVRFSDQSPADALASITTSLGSATLRSLDPSATLAATSKDGSLSFPTAAGSSEAITLQPTDTGFDFGATLADASADPTIEFGFTSGLLPQLEADGQTIDLVQSSPGPTGPTTTIVGSISPPTVSDASSQQGPVSVVLSATDSRLRPGEYLLAYALDPAWLADPTRAFPVTLDPTWCIGTGASGCTHSTTTGTFDSFMGSGTDLHNTYPVGWKTTRIGVDGRNGDCAGGTNCAFGTVRGLYYFDDVALPDGGAVTAAKVTFRVNSVFGTGGQSVKADLMTETWGSHSTWDQLTSPSGWTATDGSPTVTVPAAGNTFDLDVTTMVRDWYMRNPKNGWRADYGFMLKMDTEASPNEVMFDNASATTSANRPVLTISYVPLGFTYDFDPALGPNYAPGAAVAGQTFKLPVILTNTSSSSFTQCPVTRISTSDCADIGWRWLDSTGAIVTASTGILRLGATLSAGASSSSPVPLVITAPSSPGQYTLRLDVVHELGTSVSLWQTDWATPSAFYARQKKLLSSDNTRWVGKSIEERDDFTISVGTGAGAGDTTGTTFGDGGTATVDLASGNLTYTGAGGVGFSDLDDIGLTYAYNSANATGSMASYYDCPSGYTSAPGILGACGWSTNYDERVTATATADTFVYQDPSGTRDTIGRDGEGQLSGAGSVVVTHPRVTFFDDNGPSSGALTYTTAQHYSGSGSLTSASNVNANAGATPLVHLQDYPFVSFAVRTSAAPQIGVAFKIKDLTDSSITEQWFVYTVGTNWTTGFVQVHLTNGFAAGAWTAIGPESLFSDARSAIGAGLYDDLEVTGFDSIGKTGATGSSYFDAIRFEPGTTTFVNDTNPSWTANSAKASLLTGDSTLGSASIQVTPAAAASSPDCNPCTGTSGALGVYPFVSWDWRKAGGTTIATVLHFKDDRADSGGTGVFKLGDIVYYAGPSAPPYTDSTTANIAFIQVADSAPSNWTSVHRDALADAENALGMYNDYSANGDTLQTTQAPSGDMVHLLGWAFAAIDGSFGRWDNLWFGSTSRLSSQYGAVAGDDWQLFYDAAGTMHAFNQDGLLTSITDPSGNATTLHWDYDHTKSGQAAWSLTLIHAPGDGLPLSSGTAKRQIVVTHATGSVTFQEQLGGASPVGRSTVFNVATSGTSSHALDDLLSVVPARTPTGICATSGPRGCTTFTYTDGTNHQLARVTDPRWDGTTNTPGANDSSFGIDWTSGLMPASPSLVLPSVIRDRSHIASDSSGAALVRILTYDDNGDTAKLYERPLYQSATEIATGAATHEDLSPDGAAFRVYAPQQCTGANCVANPPTGNAASVAQSGTTTILGYWLDQVHGFDGLARTTSTLNYTAVGTATAAGPASITREGTKAAAQIDSIPDPITAAEVAWGQSDAQYVASMSDSAGLDRDLYRTTYRYDEKGRVTDTVAQVRSPNVTYAPTILHNDNGTTAGPQDYYRFEDLAGTCPSTTTDSGTSPHAGTYTSMGTCNNPGALVGVSDPGVAPLFNGTTSRVDSAATIPTTAYSIEAWVKSTKAGQVNLSIAGRWTSTAGALLWLDADGFYNFGQDGSSNPHLSSGVTPRLNAWDHVVVSWDGVAERMYVNGRLVALQATTIGPGSPTGTFEIGASTSGTAGTFFTGSIDEVALYPFALEPSQVEIDYQAGHGLVAQDTETFYNASSQPTQVDDNFLANAGFESGALKGTGWTTVSGASSDAVNPRSGLVDLALAAGGKVTQDVALVPGQTFRFQVYDRPSASGATPRITVAYWRKSIATWVVIDPAFPKSYTTDTVGAWTNGHAWDLTVPVVDPTSLLPDSDGRVRITLENAGTGTVLFDDAAVLSSNTTTSYQTFGLPLDACTFAAQSAGGAASPTECTRSVAPVATAVNPAIFPTTTIADNIDGVFDPAHPDQDISTITTLDPWGRTTGSIDNDGVTTTTTWSTAGNNTDRDSVTTGPGLTTSATYDPVGNLLTSASPMGEVTASTYDLRDHAMTTTAPDGLATRALYNDEGELTASIVNPQNGPGYVPSGTAGLDNLTTSYAYDANGKVTAVIGDPDVAGSPTFTSGANVRSDTTYDLLGDVVSQTSEVNRAANGGAELQSSGVPAAWTLDPAFTLRTDGNTTFVHRATDSFKGVVPNPSVLSYATSATIPVTVGTTYVASAFATGVTGNSSGARATVKIRWFSDTGATISDVTAATITTGATQAWVAGSGSVTPPSNATAAAVRIELGNTTIGDTVYVDDVSLIELRTTTSYFATVTDQTTTPNRTIARTSSTGTQPPVPPTSGSAVCPGAPSLYCSSVATLDFNGATIGSVDANGVTSQTWANLAGAPVLSVANFIDGKYDASDHAHDIVTTTAYDVLGHQVKQTDVLGRATETAYDAVGRTVLSQRDDTSGAARTISQTVYSGAGRTDRVADPIAIGASCTIASFDAGTALSCTGQTWTKDVYDAAGRQVATLAHYDPSGNAQLQFDGFEGGVNTDRWGTAPDAMLAASGTIDQDTIFTSTVAPETGSGRLRFDTNTISTGEGIAWDLNHRDDFGNHGGSAYAYTFVHGHTYTVTADVFDASAATINLNLGTPTDHPASAASASLTAGTWTRVSTSWTPASDASTHVEAVFSNPAATTQSYEIDNVWVSDGATPDQDIPTDSVLDKDGRTIESVAPPLAVPTGSTVTTNQALVTASAYDPAGRSVVTSVAETAAYPAKVLADAPVGYWPLDDATGNPSVAVADAGSGAASLTANGGVAEGVAGATDDARTGMRFDGSSGYLSRSSADLTSASNFTIVAWIRADALPASGHQALAVYNGLSTAGFGLGIDSAGVLGAYYGGATTQWNSSGATITPGTWHMVALSSTGTSSELYLDGATAGSTFATVPLSPGAGFAIGGMFSTSGYSFAGVIDEVSTKNSVLTGTQIAAYYAAGRQAATSAIDLTTRTTYDVDGRATDTWDPKLIRAHTDYDRLGRVIDTIANDVDGVASADHGTIGGGAADDDAKVIAAYDDAGEQIATCSAYALAHSGCRAADPTDVTASHTYFDPMGRAILAVAPVNATATAFDASRLVYDTLGRLTRECDYPASLTADCASSTVDRYTDTPNDSTHYDALGRLLVSELHSGPATGTTRETVTTTYYGDGTTQKTENNSTTESTGVTLNEGDDNFSYTFDSLGRPMEVQDSTGADLTKYIWNDDGTLQQRLDYYSVPSSGSFTTSFSYDWDHRVSTITPATVMTSDTPSFTYGLNGLLATRQDASSSHKATISYDAAFRPTNTCTGASSCSGSPAVSLSQTYDRDGNVTSDSRSFSGSWTNADNGGNTQTFTYDKLGRLSGSSGLAAGAIDYAYDLDGNRVGERHGGVTTTYAYDRTDELVSRTNGTSANFTYTAHGDMSANAEGTAASTTTYTLDVAGKNVTISPPSGPTQTLTYDALGRLHSTKLSTASNPDTYRYVGSSQTSWDIALGAGGRTDSLIGADGSRLATTAFNSSGTKVALSWLVPDLHGSSVATLSEDELTFQTAYRFDGCGLTVGTPFGGGQPYRYQGQLDVSPDPSKPLYVDGARFESPGIGAFTSRDSVSGRVQDPLSMNRFLYAEANPTTLVDPTGHYVDGCHAGCDSSKYPTRAEPAGCDKECRDNAKPTSSSNDWSTPLATPPATTPTVATSSGDLDHTLLGDPFATGTVVGLGGIVWRVIRPDEDPLTGIFAKDPDAAVSVNDFVRYGSKGWMKSQWIATTTDWSVAEKNAINDGGRVVEIDLNDVDSNIVDLTTDAGRDANLTNPLAKNFAKASSEIVIEGEIPPSAIVRVYSTEDLIAMAFGEGPVMEDSGPGSMLGPDTYGGSGGHHEL